MVIRHNLSAINSQRILGVTSSRKGNITKTLSSGYRINCASDDAAGLSISEKMRRQIRGLTQASLNAQDGISLCQTAEGALHEVHDMLQRVNELAVKAANDTNSYRDREYLQQEIKQLQNEFDRIASTTKFNEQALLDGDRKIKSKEYQTAANQMIHIPKMNIIVMESIKAEQVPSGTTAAGNAALKNLLKEEIVPNAVQALLDTFPDTFGYLEGSEIGIGLRIYDNYMSSVIASVSAGESFGKMGYMLSVNTAFYDGTEAARVDMERTISHEMMHALMSEALTAGMTGQNKDGDITQGFPSWFVEGTAQLISGGFEPFPNNWVEQIPIYDTHDEGDIEWMLRYGNHRLGSGTSGSEYGTGYLALMYMGSLIGGSDTFNPDSIAQGVDTLLSYIRGGASLDKAIADLTGYKGINDFINNFPKDGAGFIKTLVQEVKANGGTGSILKGKFTTSDILENGDYADDINERLFQLDTEHTMVANDYSNIPNHVVVEGGSLYDEGEPGWDHPNAGGGTIDPGPITPPTPPDPDPPDPGPIPNPGTNPPNPPLPPTSNPNNSGNILGEKSLEGTPGWKEITLHIGADATYNNRMRILLPGVSAAVLGVQEIDVTTREGAVKAIEQASMAIHYVSTQRSRIGAYQNRLEYTIRNLDHVIENTKAAESRIRDTDMAKAMVEFSKYRFLEEAGQAILAQANHQKKGVLQLLK